VARVNIWPEILIDRCVDPANKGGRIPFESACFGRAIPEEHIRTGCKLDAVSLHRCAGSYVPKTCTFYSLGYRSAKEIGQESRPSRARCCTQPPNLSIICVSMQICECGASQPGDRLVW
jgi:hypothetical protein